MKPFQLIFALGLVIVGLACSGSTKSSAPVAAPPPFTTTVSDLVKNHTNETEAPAALNSLNLSGSDVEDPHAFDPVLGIH